jgi:hypothetical protein
MAHKSAAGETIDKALARGFFLLVVDCDTKRFTLDGPIFDREPWDREIKRICRSGREVFLYSAEKQAVLRVMAVFKSQDFDEWPMGSIVDLPVTDRARRAIGSASFEEVLLREAPNALTAKPVAKPMDRPQPSGRNVVRRRGKSCAGTAARANT